MTKSRRKLKIILPAIACAVLFFFGIWFDAQRQFKLSDAYATACNYLNETEEIISTYGMLDPNEPSSTPLMLAVVPSEPPKGPDTPSMDCDGGITWETVDGMLTLVFHTQEALDQWAASGQNREWNADVKAVRFEEGVESVPAEAFAHRSIAEAFFPASLREIGDNAFLRCDTLEQIHWQEGLREIGTSAFRGTAIKELILPDGLVSVSFNAFSEMPNLQTVYLPDSIKDLRYTFIDCPMLESIRLPIHVEVLHAGFLEGASALRELTVPGSVQIIDLDLAAHGGVRRIIFEGSPLLISRLNIEDYPALEQIVFCSEPPAQDAELMSMIEDGGLGIYGSGQCTLYYLNSCASYWTPNGETEWNGFPIAGINSLEDLPPLE